MIKQIRWGRAYAQKSDAFSGSEQWSNEADEFISVIANGDTVMDFACNTGRFYELLRERRTTKFIGVDINPHAIEIAKGRYGVAGWYETLDSIPTESVDHVVCMHALPQFEFPELEFTSIWRVLKRGGQIHVITNNKMNDWLWAPLNVFNGYEHDSTRFRNYGINDVKRLMKDTGYMCISLGYRGGSKAFDLFPWFRPRLVFHGKKA